MSNLIRKFERHALSGAWFEGHRKILKPKSAWGHGRHDGSGRSTEKAQIKRFRRKRFAAESRRRNRA